MVGAPTDLGQGVFCPVEWKCSVPFLVVRIFLFNAFCLPFMRAPNKVRVVRHTANVKRQVGAYH